MFYVLFWFSNENICQGRSIMRTKRNNNNLCISIDVELNSCSNFNIFMSVFYNYGVRYVTLKGMKNDF